MMPGGACHAFFVLPALLLAGEAGRGDPGEQDRASREMTELEARVREEGKAFSLLLAGDPPAYPKAIEQSQALLEECRELAECYRRRFSSEIPELRDWLKDREELPLREFQEAPVVLFGAATEEELLLCWRRQLRGCAAAIRGILDHDPEVIRDWLYWQDREGRRSVGQPFFSFEQIRDCVREARKLIALLTLPPRVTRLKSGRSLYGGDGTAAGDWQGFGGGETRWQAGSLRIKGEGISVWCMKDFEDAVVSFDFTPVAGRGGALFAFPALPLPGKDYEASAGKMEQYNRGLDAIHVSLCRSDSGKSNLRRTGRGLKMLSSTQPDPCARLGQTYRIEILSFRESHEVLVDGKLIHAYVDAGCYGTPLTRGRFGIRHFSGETLESLIGKFRVVAVE
jgi:hypothetical protein